MTGTSIDGIDAAVVRIEGEGLGMRAAYLTHVSRELGAVGEKLRRFSDQVAMDAATIAGIMHEFAALHARVCREVWQKARDLRLVGLEWDAPDFVSVHGQTVYHKPPISWQLMQPAPIALEMRCPVVFDLRAADIAAGGQGAPLTPLADWVLFSSETESVGVVNLGGFCNVTLLPRRGSDGGGVEGVRGRDVCSCNHLLNMIARIGLDAPFDRDGAAAKAGRASPEFVGGLRAMFARQVQEKRSLGTGDELHDWVRVAMKSGNAGGVLASACRVIGGIVAEATAACDRVILAGGGARNLCLVDEIANARIGPVIRCDDLGIPAEAREAVCWAVLGALSQDRVAVSLGEVTGVLGRAPVAGAWVAI